jgi:tetratricopeptide (TPR) repeat protein
MKKFMCAAFVLLIHFMASAQTDSERYEQRYDMLVSRLGAAGIGVETVLDNWAKVDSTNAKMLFGRFSYYFTKAQTSEVVSKPNKRYLGMEPLITLKDSLGNDVYYYQHNVFDDELYGRAIKEADKAISLHPDRLDFRFMKANAYIAYEKESPDMALAYLFSLIDEDGKGKKVWLYGEEPAEPGFFEESMQEYCYSFYSIGSETSREAFRRISEKLLGIYPTNPEFACNIGSYYLVNHEYKTALKHYDKVLKKHPGNMTALQNALLAAKRLKNAKLEKKYQAMIQKQN